MVSMALIIFPVLVAAEMGVFEARILALQDEGNDEYSLQIVKLSEPYGYTHKQDEEIIIHLRFQCPLYECTDMDTQPTLEEYHQAIDLLRQHQVTEEIIKLGVVDRGFAQIKGTENEYQSNALEVVDGVVCSDYDFFSL